MANSASNPPGSGPRAPTREAVLGVDTGGTFTDFVLLQGDALRIHKVLSTPDAPERAILQGIHELGLDTAVAAGSVSIVHGSTVATNAALEGKGVKTALISNIGFKDLLSIGRQTRRELYNLQPAPITPPVAAALCFEMPGRITSDGTQVDAIPDHALQALQQQLQAAGVEAVAINLLFSFLNPAPERTIKQALAERWFVSASHEVLAEAGEYERGIATWLNASLGPKVTHYLQRLQQQVSPSSLAVMQSTGGTMNAATAGQSAVNMLLSGPAGGLAAARFIARQTGFSKLLTFDMGGTSTDVALIDGDIRLTNEGSIGPWPVAVPQVDMHTIGAGGGSIAHVDAGGILQVGPQSAGAAPGPACYGQGGTQATVTDANAVLGRLPAQYFLGGNMRLDLQAARQALDALAGTLRLSRHHCAQGIIDIANEHMVRALRVISIERGYHLDDFHLCCFGGAGGLHVCALAEAMGMQQAIVPNQGGVLSALGMVVAPTSRQLSHALQQPLAEVTLSELEDILAQLQHQGKAALQEEGIATEQMHWECSLDVRYQGQRFYLNQVWDGQLQSVASRFHAQHEQRYGHRLNIPLELVNARCKISAGAAVNRLPRTGHRTRALPTSHTSLTGLAQPVPVYWREDLGSEQVISGPALIAETVSTTLLAEHWQARVDPWGNLILCLNKTQH